MIKLERRSIDKDTLRETVKEWFDPRNRHQGSHVKLTNFLWKRMGMAAYDLQVGQIWETMDGRQLRIVAELRPRLLNAYGDDMSLGIDPLPGAGIFVAATSRPFSRVLATVAALDAMGYWRVS